MSSRNRWPSILGLSVLVTGCVVLSGCRDGYCSGGDKGLASTLAWKKATLASKPLLDDAMRTRLDLAVAKATAPIRKQRLAETRQLHADGNDVGFSPRYSLMKSVLRFGLTDANRQERNVLLVPVEEEGVAHAHQQDLLFVGVSHGEQIVPVATLVGASDVLAPKGLACWESSARDKLRLFLISTGPVFQGSASLQFDVWEIDVASGATRGLLSISGPEVLIESDCFRMDVDSSDSGMTVDLRLEREADTLKKTEGKPLGVIYKSEIVTVSILDRASARIRID